MPRALPLLGLLLAAALGLTACGGDGNSGKEPPKIAYGRDVCARCHMIISDERFAAGLVAADGSQLIFDDVGEMIATVQEEGLKSRRVWVHDYDSKQWLDGTTAFYVVHRSALTPMGTGVVAFKTQTAAAAYAAANQGSAMTWSDILATWRIGGMR